MPDLYLAFLGSPLVLRDGKPIQTDRRKAVALLAYLAVTGKAHRRDELAALFWPDYEPERAYAYLRRALWEANQMVGSNRIVSDRDRIQFERQAEVDVDVHTFERLLDEAKDAKTSAIELLEKAVGLYRGDFLAGFNLRDSLEFDQWQENQAEHYRRRLSEALERLARLWLEQSQFERALSPAQRLVNLNSLNETAQRLLMEIYARAGQRSHAVHQYEVCVQTLQAELGVRPEPQTTALYEQIRAGTLLPAGPASPVVAGQAGQAPAGRAGQAQERPPAPGYLPLPASPFIGRRSELAEITYLLAKPDCRLVTVYGPGGMGKTRLALQAARAQAGQFSDGAFFVSLAAVVDAGLIPHGSGLCPENKL